MKDQLKTIIERYTPALLEAVVPTPGSEITQLETLAGLLPDSYREFLSWMGNRCPFLDGEELAYSPKELVELVYEDPELQPAAGFLLIGVDKSGNSSDIHLRKEDGMVVRIGIMGQPITEKDLLLENATLASYLLTTYVRNTLAPSHSFHFAAGFPCQDDAQAQSVLGKVAAACSGLKISYPLHLQDIRFYGGDDFIVAVHQRPRSSVVYLYVGTIEKSSHDAWHNLAFQQTQAIRMPKL